MKCIMSVDEKHIKRVTDEEAAELYHDGGWRYIPKSVDYPLNVQSST